MSVVISPAAFGRRQRLAMWAPWMTLGPVVLAFAWAFAGFRVQHLTLLHVLGAVLFLLCTGGVTAGFAVGWMGMLHRGMVPTPRQPWRVEMRHDVVHVASAKRATAASIADIRSATLLRDDAWDQMRGMETSCLVLRLRHGGWLSIPGSSDGFLELLGALRRAMTVNVEEL